MFINLHGKKINESKKKFDKLINTANSLTSHEAIHILLKAIMRPTQSEYLLAIAEKDQSLIPSLTSDILFFTGIDKHLNSFDKNKIYMDNNDYIVNLGNDIILPWAWDTTRYVTCINTIGNTVGNEWKFDFNNHFTTMWLPWKLVFVSSGNHSITSGILNSEGRLPIETLIDGSVLLETIRTDGVFWYVNNKKVKEVNNYRHAAFFEIGRLLKKNDAV